MNLRGKETSQNTKTWLSKLDRYVFPWLYKVFRIKVSKIPWHFYAAILDFRCAWRKEHEKGLFPVTKYHLKIIIGSFIKIPGLFQVFPDANFIPRLFQVFQTFSWHKFYSPTFPGSPDFGQPWPKTPKNGQVSNIGVWSLLYS